MKKHILCASLLLVSYANAAIELAATAKMDNGFPIEIPYPGLEFSASQYGSVNFGTKFKSVQELCFKFNSIEDYNPFYFRPFIEGQLFSSSFSLSYRPGQYQCWTGSGDIFLAGNIRFILWSTRETTINDFEFKIIGEPDIEGEVLRITAEDNTINGINGSYFTHVVQPNTVYSVSILKNDAINNTTSAQIGSVGIIFTAPDGVKRLVSIERKEVLLSTQGEMNFFLADTAFDNTGEVLLNIKRVSLE
ncbi:hypothetical protein HB761_21485 [Vibrio campbellii]|uniref:Uncharacterized protein n=1 Tax=Vibrio campbellii TaxID=680 RepID=A0AAE9SPD1_9VIBR|nr:hypothetical protein [Vibrio campbellii]UTZ29212.1 hypothetical protein HB761_21485 [Vibrio campbellii]|tara:strand:- start:172 stop:915 length:744 start_codon:yes stop_codon:yes gene_type:complete